MADATPEADWEFIEAQLPRGWRELSTAMGLARQRPAHIGQKVFDIGIALRLILHYVAQRGSMRLTTTTAAVAGIVSISQPAFFKWMFKVGPYLEALVARMVVPCIYAAENWGGYVLIAADATTVERPGAKGTTARIHYALHLSDLRPRFVRITDEKVGEKMGNFDIQPNELWIVDRGYSNPPSVLDTVKGGGDILVRVNRHSLPMYDTRARRVDVLAVLAATGKRGRAQDKSVTVRATDGRTTKARLCWLWLPKPEAEKARARAKRDGVIDPAEVDAAEYIVLLTTAPRARLGEEQVIELYRARWQVELDFKRDKSIGQLDTLPSLIPQTIHAWLCAKVLLGLIVRRLATQPVAIPPCGLASAILPEVKASATTARHRRRALVRDAAGLESPPTRAAARQAS